MSKQVELSYLGKSDAGITALAEMAINVLELVELGHYTERQLSDPDEVSLDFGNLLLAAQAGKRAAKHARSDDPSNITEADMAEEPWMEQYIDRQAG